VRWSVGTAIVILFFRRAVTWALITGASGALHLIGVNPHLPHVTFGWPWSSLTAPAAASNVLVGPLVLSKIEGIDKPALGSTTFDFMFTRKVSKPMGFLPCVGTSSRGCARSATPSSRPAGRRRRHRRRPRRSPGARVR
jgi:hypothetical protein